MLFYNALKYNRNFLRTQCFMIYQTFFVQKTLHHSSLKTFFFNEKKTLPIKAFVRWKNSEKLIYLLQATSPTKQAEPHTEECEVLVASNNKKSHRRETNKKNNNCHSRSSSSSSAQNRATTTNNQPDNVYIENGKQCTEITSVDPSSQRFI